MFTTYKKRGLILLSVIIAALLCLVGAFILTPKTTAQADEEEAHNHGAMTALSAYPTGGELNGEASAVSYYLTDDISGNITVKGEVTLCLNGHTITGDGNGSVITVSNNANFTLCDCTSEGVITGGDAGFGGGVVINDGSQFIMNGGLITDNTAIRGGGVCVGYNTGSGTFIMNGGKITDNNANFGGGVCVMSNMFEMKGGEISGNTANNDGGGVWTQTTSKMSGGKIAGNQATNGGGVYISSYTFEMTGGEISANTASNNGSGVCDCRSTFKMSGGEITGNNNAKNGGGVYFEINRNQYGKYEGKFTTSGTAVISGNSASENGGGVYAELIIGSSSIIVVPTPLPLNADIAVLSADDEEPDYTGTFTVLGGEIKNNTAANGGGVYSKGATVNMLGGAISENETYCGGGVYVEGVENDGTYYGELIMSDGALISKNTATFDAEIYESGDGGGVYVINGGTLTVKGGEISGNNTRFGGGVSFEGGTFTMTGGNIINNHADNQGGGVLISSGTFTMENGEINKNTTGILGGGVAVGHKGTFKMTGGTISENTAATYDEEGAINYDYGGVGGGIQVDGTFIMEDGTICGNIAVARGGVYVDEDGAFTMNGGTIINNKAIRFSGGGVYIDEDGAFTMNGGTICKNTAIRGGGVYVNDDAEFTMTGGTISENTATAVYDEELNRSDGGYGGGVYQNGMFTLTGGRISNNTAAYRGGGVYGYESFNISGTPIITGNKVNDSDNNIELFVGEFGNGEMSHYTITVTGEFGNGEMSHYTITVTGELKDGAIIGVYGTGELIRGFTSENNPAGKKPSAYFIPDSPAACIGVSDAETGTVTIGGEHTGGTATCTAKAICTVCNLLYGEIDPANHVFATDYTVDKEPTCTEKGSKSKHCTLCDNAKTDVQDIDMLAHSFGEFVVDKQPTCTKEGSKSKHCANCDEKSEVTAIPTIPHTLNHNPAAPATNDQNGNIEFWDCEDCNKFFADEDGKEEITDRMSVIIPKLVDPITGGGISGTDILWITLIVVLSTAILIEITIIVYRAKRKAKNKNKN